MRWILPTPAEPELCRAFVEKLGVPGFVAELLCRRGFRSVEEAARFLEPKLKSLSDPFLLPDMDAAVARILAALDRRERIVLYGDYDVDGVTSLTLFSRVLREMGAEAACFLPSRMDEGYGLSADGVARCVAAHRPQLLIAVDCGTSSVAEIASLRAQGIDAVVFDHHEPKASALPDCAALVNPKLGRDFHYLCSVGLVFKTCHALLKRRPVEKLNLRDYLDLVALGTVADLVPLVEENRIFVRRGLRQIALTRWPGVRALTEVAGVRWPLTPADVGFKLGPRLNAAGRLGTAQDALELLLTEDSARARALAESLNAQNQDRRAVEDAVLAAAQAQLAEWFRPEDHAAIVVGAPGWHPGVIGIVASRLAKAHHRPTLVVGFDGHGVGKGSGRSIHGLSLVAALAECGGLLEKHGGHEMAAGLTMRDVHFSDLREAFCACARRLLTDEQLQARLTLDAELMLAEIDFRLLGHLETLQPFGMGNPRPLFFARGVTLAAEPRVMKEKHLSLQLRQGFHEARGVWFGGAEEKKLPPQPWDVAFEIERNEYQGYVTAQMQLRAVRTSTRPRE
jgi:single-stranded-DNA-specific exonuclease